MFWQHCMYLDRLAGCRGVNCVKSAHSSFTSELVSFDNAAGAVLLNLAQLLSSEVVVTICCAEFDHGDVSMATGTSFVFSSKFAVQAEKNKGL